jgi:hypothetical protein
MPSSVPRLLAILPDIIPSTMLCVVKPLLGLHAQRGIRFRVALERYLISPWQVERSLRWADLVVFCRNVEPRYGYILDAVLERGIPYVYDIDDNFFVVPPHVDQMLAPQAGRYYSAPERLEQLKRYLRSASLVRVYSRALLEQMSLYSSVVQQVEATVDWNLIRSSSHEEDESVPLHRQADGASQRLPSPKVKIVYATSRRDDDLFSLLKGPLQQVLEEYPCQVEMHFWGFHPAEFRDMPNVSFRHFDPHYDRFMTRFSSAGFDIGLAPMLDDEFHRAKTNSKFREYGACSIAGIYSNVPLYADWVEDGKTGLLVGNTPQAWYAALVRLIQDAGLRRRLGGAACARVRQLYSQGRFQETWHNQIQAILAHPTSRPAQAIGMLSQESTSPPGRVAGNREHQPVLSQPGKWRREVPSLFARSGSFYTRLRTHSQNVWWLLKINAFKRL